MEKGKFIFDPDEFEKNIVKQMKDICTEMDTVYAKADTILKNDIENYDGWKGKQKEQLVAFMNLLIQFHKDLSDVKASPSDTFYKTIKEFPKAVEDYPKNAKSYVSMKGVWK